MENGNLKQCRVATNYPSRLFPLIFFRKFSMQSLSQIDNFLTVKILIILFSLGKAYSSLVYQHYWNLLLYKMDEMRQLIRIISVRATEVWDRLFCLSDRERLNLAAPSFKMASNTWASIKWVSQISLKITKCRQAVTLDPTGQNQ